MSGFGGVYKKPKTAGAALPTDAVGASTGSSAGLPKPTAATATGAGEAASSSAGLRFGVGSKVQAYVKGRWVDGTVIRVWDEGNPYRIELEDGEGTNVWGPADTDQFVKPRPGASAEGSGKVRARPRQHTRRRT